MHIVANPPPRPELSAGARPTAIVPKSMDEAYRLAKAIIMSGTAPKGVTTPEACMIAIMHGLEIGLPPLTALQRISVINGRPTLWGDGAMSLVRGSGLCEYVKERVEGTGDNRVAICEAQRKGEPEPIVRTFSVADAKAAGLWMKKGRDGQPTPWQQYPERMLQMRARGFALRDGWADVLGGMYLREEIDEDERSSKARDVSPITSGIGHKPGQLPPARAQHPPQPTPQPRPPQPIPPQPEDGEEDDWPPADEAVETPPTDPMHEEGRPLDELPAEPGMFPPDAAERQKLFEAGRAAAERSDRALQSWLNKLPPSQRELLGTTAIDLLRSRAKEAAP